MNEMIIFHTTINLDPEVSAVHQKEKLILFYTVKNFLRLKKMMNKGTMMDQ